MQKILWSLILLGVALGGCAKSSSTAANTTQSSALPSQISTDAK